MWIKTLFTIVVFYHSLVTSKPKPDVIHAHLAMHPAFAAVLAGKKLGIPTIVKCGNAGPRFALNILSKSS